MTIADKLTQIAENTSKVYEAGYQKGKADASLIIKFTINSTIYFAIQDMTWGEWIATEYNIIGAHAGDSEGEYMDSVYVGINGVQRLGEDGLPGGTPVELVEPIEPISYVLN